MLHGSMLLVVRFPSCSCHILVKVVIFSRFKFSIMKCKVLSSELSLANVIILSLKNQLTHDHDCPYYSHITKILRGLVEKLNLFIMKLYRLKKKSLVNLKSLNKNVKICVRLLEEFVCSLKNDNAKTLPNFDKHMLELTEKYAKLLLFLARLQVNSDGKPEDYGRIDVPENYEYNNSCLDIVPETPPKCRHKPVCDEVATVRGNMPFLWGRLCPWLSSSIPVPAIAAKFSADNRAVFPCEIQQYCGTLRTSHPVHQRNSAKRPFPAVFVVTDSHYSPPKKLKNAYVA
uniref:Uncharacterized protein n=1 Tax=Daphnia galeata TaxID=27404 RepID=A0A8J2W9C1_9CRUS|nr:unnamed protein product [Daphnia galeata]